MEPLLATGNNRCGRWRDRRPVINGIIHRLGTGCQWREPPEHFGRGNRPQNATCCGRPTAPGRSCSNTSRPSPTPWVTSTGISPSTPPKSTPTSTPPGPRKTRRRQRPVLQERLRKDQSRAGAHVPAPAPRGGGAPGEALGRSRGGLTAKLHLSADGRCRPLSLVTLRGQRANCTQFERVMDEIRVPRRGQERCRAGDQQNQALPGRRHPLRQARIRLPRRRHRRRTPAVNSSSGFWSSQQRRKKGSVYKYPSQSSVSRRNPNDRQAFGLGPSEHHIEQRGDPAVVRDQNGEPLDH
ncbi:hypothetical protein ACF05T_13515 [Streptomyces lateritius]|uniref:Transposase n=1 Tax=Streptomyces lateritius TaxID=67313 RepID=A0ABW6YBC3_9ACTN